MAVQYGEQVTFLNSGRHGGLYRIHTEIQASTATRSSELHLLFLPEASDFGAWAIPNRGLLLYCLSAREGGKSASYTRKLAGLINLDPPKGYS